MIFVAKLGASLIAAIALAYLAGSAETSGQSFPEVTVVIPNNTGAAANHLQVNGFGVSLNPVTANAPGCPQPTVVLNSLIPISTWVIVWPEECVDPGESITFNTLIDCTDCGNPYVSNYIWSTTFATLTNSHLGPKGAVHVVLGSPSNKIPPVVNAPVCAPPTLTPGSALPFTTLDITWPSPCVDSGESVKIDLYQFAYLPFGGTIGTGCTTCTAPTVSSYSWSPAPVGGVVEVMVERGGGAPTGWLVVGLVALSWALAVAMRRRARE